jgi:beta-xylosidase
MHRARPGGAIVARVVAPAGCALALSVALWALGAAAPGDRVSSVRDERQPIADLGNGTYRNPVLAGEYPDPSVVRVGPDYYMTHTPGPAAPALLVWHSRDLVNWEPLGPALSSSVGDIWAPDIGWHDGRFYIYFPARIRGAGGGDHRTNYVVTAKDPAGPWSAPVDLGLGGIDPGHVVDTSGRRYLYLDDGRVARLSDDGLRATSAPSKVYDGWDIPADWNIECKCLESPKLFFRRGYYYLVSAEGGTAGPSTSHMVIVARSPSPEGPWQNMPGNPLLRTRTRAERWWSQGHGTIIEAADGTWWIVFHAFENGYRTLGRQTLLLPVAWTADGWPEVPADAATARTWTKPVGANVGHGLPLSDAFTAPWAGWQWRHPGDVGAGPFTAGSGEWRVRATGAGSADAAMQWVLPVNHSYEAQVEVEAPPGVEAGVLLHYDRDNFAGAGMASGRVFAILRGRPRDEVGLPPGATRVFLKVRNIEHDVELLHSADGLAWTRFETGLDMSGYHHDTFPDWQTLKIALYAAGDGTAVFRGFTYRGR